MPILFEPSTRYFINASLNENEDFGYDISDYMSIAPEYGTMDIVDKLIAEIHKRDLKLVLDMVLNHTSDQHPWFLKSKESR